jgi:DDE_Tnp_1-associated
MSSIFSSLSLWKGDHCYVTAHADFLHHQIDPAHLNVGTTCLMTCSSSLFRRLLELFPPVDDGTLWPYSTTPLRVCQTGTGKRFAVHFPAFGGPRVADSLEQLAARAEDGTALSDRQVRDEALSDRAAVTSLYEALQRLPDPRRGQGKRYELARLFCLLLLAKLAGQTSLSGATEWIRHRGQEIAHHFGLRRTHMPCQMTYYRVLARIDAQMLDEILAAFFIRLRGRAAVRKRTQSAQRPARAIAIMPSSPSMEKPFAQRASRPIRFICSVVMT